jgi:hypothetical protein
MILKFIVVDNHIFPNFHKGQILYIDSCASDIIDTKHVWCHDSLREGIFLESISDIITATKEKSILIISCK